MNDNRKDLEASARGLLEISRNFPEGTEENNEIPIKIAGVQTEHFPDMSLERYRYANRSVNLQWRTTK
jgi:hypothetical protein